MERILLVEDDSAIYQPLTSFLRGEGFAVRQASGQREALALLETEEFDLVLLDVGLRDGNGFSVCSAVKQRGGTAVIFLSASGDEYSVVTGLDLGADDYIAKPFNALEIVARVKAHLRRSDRSRTAVYSAGGLTLNPETCTVTKDGEPVPLTPTEYKLLSVLMRSPGRIFTRVQLSEAINGEYYENDDNTMMVHISKLREKIEDNPRKPARLVTVRGLGYRFEK